MKKLEEVDPSISEFPVEEEKKDRKYITMQELILRRQEAAKRRALQVWKSSDTIIINVYITMKFK